LLAASMVEVPGRGGQARVAEAAGMSRNTLIAGAKDLPTGVKITDAELGAVPPQRHDWHPDWNHSILPP